MAAPAELRTPHMHRAKTDRSSRVRMEAWRQWLLGGRKLFSATNNKTHYEPGIPLTPTGLLMEGHFTQNLVRQLDSIRMFAVAFVFVGQYLL
jgi:hypothetical protein